MAKSFEDLYPFKSNYMDIDGLKYHYLDEGEGPILLMLHGNPSWSFYYRNLVLAFRGRYRVIVPDHIGCGFSDKPQNYEYRLKNHISNVCKLIDHLDIDRFSLFVHDWGGPIGLGVSSQMPDKLVKMVVFNTTCELDSQYPWQIRMCRVPFIGEKATRGLNLFARMAASFGVTRRKLEPEVRAGLLKPYDSYANCIATHRFIKDIPFERNHPTRATGTEIMSRMDSLNEKPMMICWGMKDICFTPRFLDGWKKRYPNAEVHEFGDCGHYVLEDAHEDIIPLAEAFLAK